MCDNCVKAGKMTEQEAEEQREMFALVLDGMPMEAPEDVLLRSLMSNPADASLILGKMVQAAFASGWAMAVIRNPLTGEVALGLAHASGGGGIPMGLISEETATAIANDTTGK